ncbi:hypothetical protein [Mechercharimyces sp. CAU 1602]|uniref:hypothetical protein n=1 Tax=Mechercharimyces sp. CAU 1602 TaxID=2973933 RepID=UPI002162CE0C|nr:hypothetical protein [Mechercharimyces sp. CAU 1602]MCS1352811.1 hypothetical protein [Mechercharimyces sp. CAU 1602]
MDLIRNLLGVITLILMGKAVWGAMENRQMVMATAWVLVGLVVFGVLTDIGGNNEALAKVLTGEFKDEIINLGE